MSIILFVDDDISLLNIVEEFFSDEFSILIANNETKAMQILEEQEIAIAVVDLHLGEKSGFNLLNFIKNIYPATYRIMLTGDLQFSNVKKAINEVNVTKYYNKPVSFETLREDFIELISQYKINKIENNQVLKTSKYNIAKFYNVLIIKNHKTLYQRTIKSPGHTNPQLIGNFIIAINEFIKEILVSEGSLHTINHDAGTILVHNVSDDLFYVGIAKSGNIKTRVVLKEFANLTQKYFKKINLYKMLDSSTESILNKELDILLDT